MRQTAADRVLFEIKTKGPEAAPAIAQRLSVTPMAVRQHLYQLRRLGLVDYHDERRPVGRPARIWSLTEKAQLGFPDSHAELTVEMTAAIRAIFGEAGIDRLLAERTRMQTGTYRKRLGKAGAALDKRLYELARIRSEHGYMAELFHERDGSWLLVENHCPISAAANSCPAFCSEEMGVFRAVLGKGVEIERVEHIAAGGRRCAYRVTPRASARRRHA